MIKTGEVKPKATPCDYCGSKAVKVDSKTGSAVCTEHDKHNKSASANATLKKFPVKE